MILSTDPDLPYKIFHFSVGLERNTLVVGKKINELLIVQCASFITIDLYIVLGNEYVLKLIGSIKLIAVFHCYIK